MNIPENIRKLLLPAGAVASGGLLFAAFPPLEWGGAVWIALVPLMLAAGAVSPRRAARLGFLAGVVFWLASVWWVIRVSAVGWIMLALYCALYFMPFAAAVSWWMRRIGTGRWPANVGLMILAAAAWAGFEFIRSTFLTGFPWNPLGATQYRNIALIQIAGWGGVYAVSALIVWVNAAVVLTLLRYAREGLWRRRVHPELIFAFAAVVLAMSVGWRVLKAEPTPTRAFRVALVQPNIPQDDKWTPEKFEMIYNRLRDLTAAASRAGQADLIVWPETAVPDDVRNSERSFDLVRELAAGGVPILLGSMDTAWLDDGPRYFNSSFLFDTNAAILQVYDKRHLVIFGEYVPLQPFVPFVRALTPIQESFSAGTTSTVFRLERPDIAFSVLICFEDTVARLARESVRNGARLIINQTNDAWFDPSAASKQHMIQCVFRCVENRVPGVRSTNTGISCCIDRNGRIHAVLDDGRGHVRVSGFRTAAVAVPGDAMPLTFYTRQGDVFAGSCAALAVAFLVVARARERRK